MRKGLTIALLLLFVGNAEAQEDIERGAMVFKRQCSVCHSAEDARNKVGPSLQNVVGRPVATVEDFRYSSAMVAFGSQSSTWNEELLTQFLTKPRDVVKGTSMAFVGVKNPDDLKDILAYLKHVAGARE